MDTKIIDEIAMERAISRMTYEIIEKNKGIENVVLIGILTRGKYIAEKIQAKINQIENITIPIGFLDIYNYRDDIEKNHLHDDETEIGFDIVNKKVVLVDDVLFTGRSCRAGIDAIMEKGRPLNIQLAVLVDRGHREIPIRADYVGKNLPTSKTETVKVSIKPYDSKNEISIIKKEI